ncbi:MAG TPA: serine hydrolase [Candidatus Aquilonibacter sp.]|nr:serine hydrolase [Candidatus Aquilonibacter sp.]
MDAPLDERRLGELLHYHGLEPASAVLHALEPGWQVALDPQRPLYPASMIKTPLAAAALGIADERGAGRPERLAVTQANMTYNDAPSPLVPGYSATVTEVCELAISRSDNVATNMLFDAADRDRATRYAQERLGLRNTAFYRKLSGSDPLINDPGWDGVHHNSHPAGDAARMFELIALDRVAHSDLLRGALAHQYWNDKLSKGLREGDTFAHKTGDTSDVTHDGGILTTNEGRTYVIVVYTGLGATEANNARFGPFMRDLRVFL